ncbi:molecular chaperone HscC [Salinivibrio sp. IB574]|uniref:Hsp70 family protein n=1 Tax=Salinivibrio sp. IB574 TaxID=1909444 RepID=UPI00098977EF|nr:Hsp70 family protein [Salinivibrio sp. IB574]OOF23050.1 molecular chaperone HscC [Salinivibrio sp. IB574]
MTDYAIGIDLGTTHSSIGVWQGDSPVLIPNSLGEYLTPSIISCEGDHVLVGKAAYYRKFTHPKSTVSVFKRSIGTEKTYRLGNNKVFNARELCSIILSTLKKDAEIYLNTEIREVIVSVPAYFNDQQRKEVRLAADMAGLDAVRLINEPTAAALAYHVDKKDDGQYLVFDLGGGTFDVSIVEYSAGLIEVHSSAGNNRLGGEDFTEDLVDVVLERACLDRETISLTDIQAIYEACEKAKKQYSKSMFIEYAFKNEEGSKEQGIYLSDSDLDTIWRHTLRKLKQPLEQSLRDAKVSVHEIDDVIFVGGASRLPHVQKMATRLLSRFGRRDLDPETVVCLGAVTQAAYRMRHKAIDDLVMTDVCPYSLGVAAEVNGQSGIFSPVLERNTTVPASRVQRYYTKHDAENEIIISIYQGESFWAQDNIHIDNIAIDVSSCSANHPIDVRFSYDVNGLLDVNVDVLDKPIQVEKTIDMSPTGISKEEIEASREKLSKLKVHPREKIPNIVLLNKLHKLYEETLGHARKSIEMLIISFEEALSSQDSRHIDKARQHIHEVLADQYD